MRAIAWTDLVLVGVDNHIQRSGIHQPLLRQDGFQRLYPQRRCGRQKGVRVIVVLMVMGHETQLAPQ